MVDLNRREMILSLVAGAVTIKQEAEKYSKECLNWIMKEFKDWNSSQIRAKGAEALERSIFKFNTLVDYTYGSVHAQNFRDVPYSMQQALKGVLKRAGIDETSQKKDFAAQISKIPTNNVFSTGSPNSSEVAYTIFDNQLIQGGGTEFMENNNTHPLELNYRFYLKKDINNAKKVKRSDYPEPNWGLILNDGKIIRPEISDDGFLKEDFLIITKAPNVFDNRWAYTNNSIFLVSGIHGPGTQGFGLLLEDLYAIDKINNKIAKLSAEYWQALVHINKVEYDPILRKDIAKEIDINSIEVIPINISAKKQKEIENFDWISKYVHIKCLPSKKAS